VAHKSSTEEIGILRKIFQRYDSLRDGSITYTEFCKALEEFGHSEDDLEAMFQAVVSSCLFFCPQCPVERWFSNSAIEFMSIGFGWYWKNPLY
jgi:hypothetical protein